MTIPLHIVFRNMDSSEGIEAAIRKHAEKLEHFSEHIMRCNVTVETVGKHKQQGRLHEVRIDLTVPGTAIAIGQNQGHEDVYVAMRDAFDAVARKLQDIARNQRGEVKARNVPPAE